MAKIVAFSVPTYDDGVKALDELETVDEVKDVALAYKNAKGKVKIRQTSDATFGKGALHGALLGGVVSIFLGPLVGMAAAGAAAGGAYSAVRDKGVSDKIMKLAGEQLEGGHAAVFVLAEDDTAAEIEQKVRNISHLEQYKGVIEVGEFSTEAQKAVREVLKLHAA